MYPKTHSSFDRGVIRRHVTGPIDVSFFHPQAFNRPVTHIGNAQTLPSLPKQIIHMGGIFCRNMQLIATFTHITDPRSQNRCSPHDDLTRSGKTDGRVRQVAL